MHIFKASADTYDSVVSNKKHAFVNSPRELNSGDMVLLSKNKTGRRPEDKQISHYAIFQRVRPCSDSEIEELWPGNRGRWKYITEFQSVSAVPVPFDLHDVLPQHRARHYGFLMTHGKVTAEDEQLILSRLAIAPQQMVNPSVSFFPEEVRSVGVRMEGATTKIVVNAYERDSAARRACIAHHGATCKICAFDFNEVYGKIGEGYIHVHHIVPLSHRRERYQVNPVTDLIPVCPNCHAMLHRADPPLSPGDLQSLIKIRFI